MIQRLKRYLHLLFQNIFYDNERNPLPSQQNTATIGSAFFVLISLILTGMNIAKQYWFMAGTTLLLTIGFSVALVFGLKKKQIITKRITALLCGIIFSVYAVTGQNEGFACLWILLIPIISMQMLGIRIGFLLSLYFQLFLLVLLYTPLSVHIQSYYTATFIARFPILYFADFGCCTILMSQRQELHHRIQLQAFTDGLTGLKNRLCYMEAQKKDDPSIDLAVIAMDMNCLKQLNDLKGHEAGDRAICEAANIIQSIFENDDCFRIGGDEFTVISTSRDLDKKVLCFRESAPDMSIGYALRKDHPGMTFIELYRIADKAMYADKADYYQRKGLDRRHSSPHQQETN